MSLLKLPNPRITLNEIPEDDHEEREEVRNEEC
jgi:hypothetical protein